jgi:hypothetical protein
VGEAIFGGKGNEALPVIAAHSTAFGADPHLAGPILQKGLHDVIR